MERFRLDGRVAIVTGAAGGIGRALTHGLAEAGADVVALDIDEEGLHDLASAVRDRGRRCWVWRQDLSALEELSAAVDAIRAETGRIDILVNNAAVARLERFNAITLANWRQLMSVNLDAPFVLSQRVAEHMISDGLAGRIINITSKNAFVAEAGLVAYDTAKAGLAMLTRTLAVELGEHGITVNSIAPGMVDTDIGSEFGHDRDSFGQYYGKHIPLEGRYADPDECVGALLLLVSNAGSYMTGQHIIVDGGVLAQQVPRLQFLPPYASTIDSGAEHSSSGIVE